MITTELLYMCTVLKHCNLSFKITMIALKCLSVVHNIAENQDEATDLQTLYACMYIMYTMYIACLSCEQEKEMRIAVVRVICAPA